MMATKVFTAVRRIQFCAGHRVMEHGSKCRHMHGHNYVAFIHAECTVLDKLGMVVDFSVLKDKIGGWIDEFWDHGFIYFQEDRAVLRALSVFESLESAGDVVDRFTQKTFALRANPTAENMASFLLDISNELLRDTKGLRVTKVELWETENCYAAAAANPGGGLF